MRAANGKLFNHPNTSGWYTNPNTAFKFSGDLKDIKLTKGALKGTYVVAFTSEKAFVSDIVVQFLNPDGSTYSTAANKLPVTTTHKPVEYLVID